MPLNGYAMCRRRPMALDSYIEKRAAEAVRLRYRIDPVFRGMVDCYLEKVAEPIKVPKALRAVGFIAAALGSANAAMGADGGAVERMSAAIDAVGDKGVPVGDIERERRRRKNAARKRSTPSSGSFE